MGKKSKNEKKIEKIEELAAEEQTLQDETVGDEKNAKREARKAKKALAKAEALKKEAEEAALENEKAQLKKDKKELKRVKKFEKSINELIKNPEKRKTYVDNYFKGSKGANSDVYTKLLNLDRDKLLGRAQQLLGFENRITEKPFMILSPDSYDNVEKVKYKLEVIDDENHFLRFNQSYVTALFFSEESLYIYNANINHGTGQVKSDHAYEFAFKDISSLETILGQDNEKNPKYSTLDMVINLNNGHIHHINLRNQRIPQRPKINFIYLIGSIILAVLGAAAFGYFSLWNYAYYPAVLIIAGAIVELIRHKKPIPIEPPLILKQEQEILSILKNHIRDNKR